MAIEFNPKPAEDLKTLTQQFNALVRLHNANVNCLALTRGEVAGLMNQLGQMDPREINSQRDANAELTLLLEKQERELAQQNNTIQNQSLELMALREEVLASPGPSYRAAADIYYQLAQECQIPEGGSLVNYIDTLRGAAQDLVDVFIGLKGGMTKQQAMEALTTALDASSQETPHG